MHRRTPQVGIQQQYAFARLSERDGHVRDERRFAVSRFGTTDLNHLLLRRVEPHEQRGTDCAIRLRFGGTRAMVVTQRRLQRDFRVELGAAGIELRHGSQDRDIGHQFPHVVGGLHCRVAQFAKEHDADTEPQNKHGPRTDNFEIPLQAPFIANGSEQLHRVTFVVASHVELADVIDDDVPLRLQPFQFFAARLILDHKLDDVFDALRFLVVDAAQLRIFVFDLLHLLLQHLHVDRREIGFLSLVIARQEFRHDNAARFVELLHFGHALADVLHVGMIVRVILHQLLLIEHELQHLMTRLFRLR